MFIKKPYKRNVRQMLEHSSYTFNGNWEYILHPDYAEAPEHYIRAFLIIQKDFINLLDYIEPADKNLETYSFRIHELILRACIEIEANFVAILAENGYSKKGDWNGSDYKKINQTHKLSSYEIKLPVWNGIKDIRTPFKPWAEGKSLPWYKTYNKTKHNRHNEFQKANFETLVDSMCGLVALLSSQFLNHNFSPQDSWVLGIGGENEDNMSSAIGGYFRVKYPDDWLEEEKYLFNWHQLKKEKNPIQKYNYK